MTNNTIHVLDMAAKLDDTAEYLCSDKWSVKEFPTPFGRSRLPEEDYIKVCCTSTCVIHPNKLNIRVYCTSMCVAPNAYPRYL